MATQPLASHRVCFDDFELDVRAGQLRRQGVLLRLRGQPLQVLEIPLERAGDVVTREELQGRIWAADTFVDFDHSLHNAIARIREVLTDSAENPRYIETLPRRGYRFIGQVKQVPMEAPKAPTPAAAVIEADVAPGPAPSLQKKKPLRTMMLWPLLTLAFLATAIWFVPRTFHSHKVSAAVPQGHSIAVLPLTNLSGDPSQDYFADGMTEELITDLAKVSSLRVVSRTSVMRFKDSKKSLPEIAQELNVDSIVEGSVTRSGNRVRITAQLLHGPTDQHLWAHSYDRDVGDVLKLQSEVAETVAQQVRAKLSLQQQSVLHSAPAVDPDAYDAFLRGRYLIDSGELNAAKGYFEQSIKKDPNYALAYVGLAESYIDLAFFRKMTAEVAYRPAEAAILKAIELDNSIGEAHDVLALMRWRFDWDWKGAEEEFESAIAQAPNYDCAHSDRSNYLALMGRKTEAMAEVARSRELSPGANFNSTESADLYLLRDYSSLVAASKKGTAVEPKDWLEHFFLGAGYEGSGNPEAAIPEYRRAVELSGGDEDPTAALAHAYAIAGNRAESTKILRELERKSKTEYVSSYLLATIYAGLGDKERAFSLLEKAYTERSLDLAWAFKSDLRLDNLRSDPRYHSLVRRMAFPDESHAGS